MVNERYLFRRQFILGTHYIKGLERWNKVIIDNKLFLTVHPDLEVLKITFEEKIIVLLGYILDPFNPSLSNLEIINNIAEKVSAADDIFPYIDSMCGRFVFIVKIKDELRIFNDAAGYRQIFYYTDDKNSIWCASQPSIIASEFGLKTSQGIVKDFYQLPVVKSEIARWYPGDMTVYKDIYHLIPNHYLDLNSGNVKRFWPVKSIKPISIEKAVEYSSKILQGAFESASNRFNLALTVTAGYDTRVLIASCNLIKEKIHFLTHTHSNLDENGLDIQIPRELLKRFGLKHHIVHHSSKVNDNFGIIFKRNVTGAKDSAERNAYAFFKYLQHSDTEMVVAQGEGGGIGKSFYQLPAFFQVNGKALATSTGMRGSRIAESAFEKWLESAKKAVDNGINIKDLLYWEMRLGNWSTIAISSYDIVFESFLPFNCRILMQYLISVDKKFRLPPNYTHVYLIDKMWPELLEIPINPPANKKEEIVGKIRSKKFFGKVRSLKLMYGYLMGS